MKASEVIAQLKTIIHHQGDVQVEGYTEDGFRSPVKPKTIQYEDGERPFISIAGSPVTAPRRGAKERNDYE